MKEKQKTTLKVLIVLFTLALMISLVVISSVQSSWDYQYRVKPYVTFPFISMGTWDFTTNEGLPPDGIVEVITQDDTKPVDPGQPEQPITPNNGLNNPDSALNKIINKRKTHGFDSFSSVDQYNGTNIKADLGLKETDHFILKFPPERPSIMYLYTTPVTIGESYYAFMQPTYNIPKGERVYPVYKNTLIQNENGQWTSVSYEVGSAEAGPYKSRVIGSLTTDNPIFVPETWKQEVRGKDPATPVLVYYGQTLTHYGISDTAPAYFLVHGDGGTYNITSQTPNVTIEVYDNTNTLVSTQTGDTATFNSTVYVDYTIKVVGAKNVTLIIN